MNSNQPKPAPTAEEQLLPLDESIAQSLDELSRHMKVQIAPIVAVRYMVANNVLCGLEERERQLTAALRSNREKDARIAELTSERDHTWTQRNADLFAERNAAWDKLRAVSEALDDGEQYDDIRLARIRAIVEGK